MSLKCRALRLARSGYYAHRRRPESSWEVANRALLTRIRLVYEQSRRTYGSRRVRAELAQSGTRCSVNRVARLMQRAGIQAVMRRRYRHTQDTRHDYPVAPNRLGRDFRVEGRNRVWLTDITYVPTEEGWLYLSVVLDMRSRRAVGWAMSCRIDRQLTIAALGMALGRRRPVSGLIHHSDRGSQYACYDYQQLLSSNGLICSMSRRGNPYDNAVTESFFKTLKVELVYRRRFGTREEAKTAIAEYIELFYNCRRKHSALGYKSPAEYEEQEAMYPN